MSKHIERIPKGHENIIFSVDMDNVNDIEIVGEPLKCLVIKAHTNANFNITIKNDTKNVVWDSPFSIIGNLTCVIPIQNMLCLSRKMAKYKPHFIQKMILLNIERSTLYYNDKVSTTFCSFNGKILFKTDDGFSLYKVSKERFQELPLNTETLRELQPILVAGI